MKFDEIKIYHVAMPLIDPWVTSYGEDYEIHSVLVNVKSDNYSAWSETCALELPTYSYESASSIFYNISKIPAAPWPVPTHIVTIPFFNFLCFISSNNCTESLAPEHPNG